MGNGWTTGSWIWGPVGCKKEVDMQGGGMQGGGMQGGGMQGYDQGMGQSGYMAPPQMHTGYGGGMPANMGGNRDIKICKEEVCKEVCKTITNYKRDLEEVIVRIINSKTTHIRNDTDFQNGGNFKFSNI